jgi:hypothetical protein
MSGSGGRRSNRYVLTGKVESNVENIADTGTSSAICSVYRVGKNSVECPSIIQCCFIATITIIRRTQVSVVFPNIIRELLFL